MWLFPWMVYQWIAKTSFEGVGLFSSLRAGESFTPHSVARLGFVFLGPIAWCTCCACSNRGCWPLTWRSWSIGGKGWRVPGFCWKGAAEKLCLLDPNWQAIGLWPECCLLSNPGTLVPGHDAMICHRWNQGFFFTFGNSSYLVWLVNRVGWCILCTLELPIHPGMVVTTRIMNHFWERESQPETFICDWNPGWGVDRKYKLSLSFCRLSMWWLFAIGKLPQCYARNGRKGLLISDSGKVWTSDLVISEMVPQILVVQMTMFKNYCLLPGHTVFELMFMPSLFAGLLFFFSFLC